VKRYIKFSRKNPGQLINIGIYEDMGFLIHPAYIDCLDILLQYKQNIPMYCNLSNLKDFLLA
jgi:hypothetical protein